MKNATKRRKQNASRDASIAMLRQRIHEDNVKSLDELADALNIMRFSDFYKQKLEECNFQCQCTCKP